MKRGGWGQINSGDLKAAQAAQVRFEGRLRDQTDRQHLLIGSGVIAPRGLQ